MPVSRFSATAVRAGRMYWLLDLTFAGKIFRYSTIDLDVASDDGDLHYRGQMLLGAVREEFDLFEIALSGLTVPVTLLHLPNVARLVAQGHPLTSAKGVLSQWIRGSRYEDRRVVLRGRLSPESEYGEDFVETSLAQVVWDDAGRVPRATERVDATTWDISQLSSEDHPLDYQLVFGCPGMDNVSQHNYYAGSLALWGRKTGTASNTHLAVISTGWVAATQVYLLADDDPTGRRFVVTLGRDDRGQPVSCVDDGDTSTTTDNLAPHPNEEFCDGLSSAAADPYRPTIDETSQLFVAWRDETSPGLGGILGDNGQMIRGAGDLIEHLLIHYSTLPVDSGRMAAAKPALNAFRIDGCIDAGCVPFEWINQALLPLLPCSMVRGPDGVYPIVWRMDATLDDVVARLEEGNGFEFGDRIFYDQPRDGVANDFTLDYGWSARTDTYAHTARLGAAHVETTAFAVGTIGVTTATETLTIRSRTSGPEGVVRVTVTVAGAESLTDGARRVDIVISATTTYADLATLVQTSTLITCDDKTTAAVLAIVDPFSADFLLKLLDDGTKPSPACALSQARLKDPEANASGIVTATLRTQFIYDRVTAEAVLEWQARARAFPIRRIEGKGAFARWGWLERGNVVALTCSRLSVSNQIAIVQTVETADDDLVAFSFVLVENPGRDSKLPA